MYVQTLKTFIVIENIFRHWLDYHNNWLERCFYEELYPGWLQTLVTPRQYQVNMKFTFLKNCRNYFIFFRGKHRNCILGRKESYERRIVNRNCYNGREYERLITVENCDCDDSDYQVWLFAELWVVFLIIFI